MSSSAEPLMARRGVDSLKTVGCGDVIRIVGKLATAVWARTTRRIRLFSLFVVMITTALYLSGAITNVPHPEIHLQFKNKSPFNVSKVALLIENRPNPVLAPLMLHFISVVPPDWRFRFMGSIESVDKINQSVAIREQVKAGKLDLTYIPSNMSTGSQEEISRFLTTPWLYEVVLQPAEWLLLFQTDSVLCANSRKNLNDFLDYHWIGAPWTTTSRWGGNGGLSLRRVSAMIDVLREQIRVDGSDPEDVWLAERLAHRPEAKVANATVSLEFSGESHKGELVTLDDGIDLSNITLAELQEITRTGKLVPGIDDWRVGFYEPMGYHTGGSGAWLGTGLWGTPEMRAHVWKYCPEVKMTLSMDASKYVPGQCGASWKRSVSAPSDEDAPLDVGYGTEIIDDVQYPVLPPDLTMF